MDNNDKWTQGIKPQTHCEELSWADARCVVSIADSYPRFLLFLHIDSVCTVWHANKIFWFEAEHCNCFFLSLGNKPWYVGWLGNSYFNDILSLSILWLQSFLLVPGPFPDALKPRYTSFIAFLRHMKYQERLVKGRNCVEHGHIQLNVFHSQSCSYSYTFGRLNQCIIKVVLGPKWA